MNFGLKSLTQRFQKEKAKEKRKENDLFNEFGEYIYYIVCHV